jgi:hypothetical protein
VGGRKRFEAKHENALASCKMGTGEHSAPFAESDACPLFAKRRRHTSVSLTFGTC